MQQGEKSKERRDDDDRSRAEVLTQHSLTLGCNDDSTTIILSPLRSFSQFFPQHCAYLLDPTLDLQLRLCQSRQLCVLFLLTCARLRNLVGVGESEGSKSASLSSSGVSHLAENACTDAKDRVAGPGR